MSVVMTNEQAQTPRAQRLRVALRVLVKDKRTWAFVAAVAAAAGVTSSAELASALSIIVNVLIGGL